MILIANVAYLIFINWLQLKNSALLGIKRSDIDKDVIQLYFNEVCLFCCSVMFMTHVAEIGAVNQFQKTDTINWHENRACSIRCEKLTPEKFRTKLHDSLTHCCA